MSDLNTDWAEWSSVLCMASIVLIITLHRSFPLPRNVKLRDSDGASSNAFQQIWICLSSLSGHLHRVLAFSQLAPAPLWPDSYTWWRTWCRRWKWRVNKQHSVTLSLMSGPSFSSPSWFVTLKEAQCVRKLHSCPYKHIYIYILCLLPERHRPFFSSDLYLYSWSCWHTALALRTDLSTSWNDMPKVIPLHKQPFKLLWFSCTLWQWKGGNQPAELFPLLFLSVVTCALVTWEWQQFGAGSQVAGAVIPVSPGF